MIGARAGARGVPVRVKPRDKPSKEELRCENLCGRTKRVRLCNPASVIGAVSLPVLANMNDVFPQKIE